MSVPLSFELDANGKATDAKGNAFLLTQVVTSLVENAVLPSLWPLKLVMVECSACFTCHVISQTHTRVKAP